MDIDVKKLRADFDKPHDLIPASDGKTLFLHKWEPSVSSNTATIIFHGITAYSGAYDTLGTPLADAGFSTYGFDLRGHGLSDGIRGDYPSKTRLQNDISECINFVKAKGFSKVVLLGSSLGNVVVSEAIAYCKDQIDGLIFLSIGRSITPGAFPEMSTGEKLKTIGKMIFAYRRPVIEYKREGMSGTDDPLFNFKYSPRFLNILSAERFMKKFQFPERLNLPVLVGIGEEDEIFTTDAARAFFDEVPSEHKSFQVIPGAKHAETHSLCSRHVIDWLKENFD